MTLFTLQPVTKKKGNCIQCGLYKYSDNPKMEAIGNFNKKIGKLLQLFFDKYDIDIFEDCKTINAINCVSVNDKGKLRNPKSNEIAICHNHIFQIIKKEKPEIIILLGDYALESVIGSTFKTFGSMEKWRGMTIPDQELKAWICPIFHPYGNKI